MFRALMPLLVIAISACTHFPKVTKADIDEVGASAAQLDGAPVSTAGFLVNSPIGGLYLYRNSEFARSEDYTGGIDVVLDSRLRDTLGLPIESGQCAVVSGKFSAFNDQKIAMGYYRSEIGYITADKIVLSACGKY